MKKSFRLTQTFKTFLDSNQSGSIILILCTVISLTVANLFSFGESYVHFWHSYLGPLTIEYWVNDLLMAIFFFVDRAGVET